MKKTVFGLLLVGMLAFAPAAQAYNGWFCCSSGWGYGAPTFGYDYSYNSYPSYSYPSYPPSYYSYPSYSYPSYGSSYYMPQYPQAYAYSYAYSYGGYPYWGW